MKNFLIYTLATITGIILSSILFFVIMIGSLSALITTGEKTISISEKSVLVLKAGVPIPDRGDPNPLSGFDPVSFTFTPTPGLNEILANIRKAAKDDKIKGILIENGLLAPGWATSDEIRNALIKFRQSGKFVIAWSDYILNQEGYFLSTSASKIYLNPGTMIEFKGLSGEVLFYKKALDKIGVEIQVIRHGKFKGAVEPYILDKLSPENREQIKDYVGSVWSYVISAISSSRSIPEDKLMKIADNLTATNTEGALSNGLIDGVIYRDALIDTLKTLSGVKLDDKIQLVPMSKYSKVYDNSVKYSTRNKIAVIFAEGSIVTGNGTDNRIGGNGYAEIIRDQRKDTSVKAIVLRVDSPGGNAVASDIMWRELELAAKVKPVVVSMGNYAASGGYYISAPATKIYASPVTISGSIGVFGLIPDAGRLIHDKLGISTETISTNSFSDFPSVFRPLSSYEREVMQKSIEKTYSEFVARVATGRKMNEKSVDSIGQGRVWTGLRALKIGLVDSIGGLEAAISGAAKLANLENYSIREYPVAEDPFTRLISLFEGEMRTGFLKKELGDNLKLYEEIKEITGLFGVQARLPYFIEIH
ncbi:MAG: signal peptide peptidase SppA [Bacteroidales bacterium]|jgi:protease-4